MFGPTINSGFPTPVHFGDRQTLLLHRALDYYRAAQFRGWLHRILAAFTGRSYKVKSLKELVAEGRVSGRRYSGLRGVPLNQILGSEGRSRDFDCRFDPLRGHTKPRWLKVMMARLADVPLPPVELIQVGTAYYVRDGHHRISVAHFLGESEIEAEVTVWEVAGPAAPVGAATPAAAEASAA